MILHDYSKPQRLGLDMDAPCPRFGWPNMVVDARASGASYPEHRGPLSIKTVLHGQELFEVGRARFAVTPERYLILNDGQRHAHRLEGDSEVFTLMFRAGLAGEVLRSLVTPADRLLDDPAAPGQDVQFFERTYPHDALLASLLRDLRTRLRSGAITQAALEERFHPILERLLDLHKGACQEAGRLPAVRHATRVELYRRLWRARDFIDASFTQSIDLKGIAHVAELSPHHLLRLFRKVFGETPHQYLTRRRLEHAKALLLRSERSVTDICFDLGFESLGSFSLLFKTRVGVSPLAFRQGASQGRLAA